jgi:hypothetical protein
MRAVRQHAVGKDDPQGFQWLGGYGRDSIADRLRTVVDVEPTTPLPLDCDGKMVIPTTADDSSFGREERYVARTSPSFTIRTFVCGYWDICRGGDLVLTFSSPVRREDVARFVRLNGQPAALSGSGEAKVWHLTAQVQPRSNYTVVVDSAIRDAYQRSLEGPREFSLGTDDYAPHLMHAVGMITTPRSGSLTMPLRSENVRSVRIIAYRVPDSARVSVMSLAPMTFDVARFIRGVKPETTIVVLPDRLNVDTTTDVPLPPVALAPDHPLVALRIDVHQPLPDAIAPKESARLHRVALYWPDRSRAWFSPYTLLQVTDLAVTARLAGLTDGAALVTGLGDGRPRAGVTVTQLDRWGRALARGVSGRDGITHLTRIAPDSTPPTSTPVTLASEPRIAVLEAQDGADRVVVALGGGRAIGFEPGSPLDPSKLGARRDDAPLVEGAIFADRDVFRPGDVVHVKGIVRYGLLGDLRLPSRSDSARLVVRKRASTWADDTTLVVRDTIVRLSKFGTVVDSVRLRAGLPLGDYAADLQVVLGTRWRRVRSTEFRVAEYRAPEFVVEVSADTARRQGDTVNVIVHGRYLFGSPMRRAVMEWSAATRGGSAPGSTIPRAAGWFVGGETWWNDVFEPRPRSQLSGTDTLDADGRAVIRIPSALLRSSVPGVVDVSLAVMDADRQVVTTSATLPINAAQVFILARPSGAPQWRVGEPASIELRVVDARGVSVRDALVRALLVRNRWEAPRVAGAGGRWVVDTVRTDELRPTGGGKTFSFTPNVPGDYAVTFTTTDGQGVTTRTTVARSVQQKPSTPIPDGYRLALSADRMRWSVGDVARVHFQSPFDDAEAWITLEREGVLEQRRQHARAGDNVVEVKISERYVPNVFVSVVLLAHAAPASKPDTTTERLRAGYIELGVERDLKNLTVTVDADRASYLPRDTAAIHVHVRDPDGHGARAEVALWAVDEGVLSLTGFHTPDILSQVYAARGVGAELWSTVLTQLTTDPALTAVFLRQAAVGLFAMTVTSTLGASPATSPELVVRTQFSSTAFYLGAVVTDSHGDAMARAALPDNLTTFRVMAAAVSDNDRYGRGDTTLLVTRPLVARAALPRFVRPGDSLAAGVVVTARDGRPRSVVADIAAAGAAVRGPAHISISLSSGTSEGRFVVQVPGRDVAGEAVTLRLAATDEVSTDGTETRLPVRPDFHPRTHAVIGAITDSQDVMLTLPADIDARRSRMRLRIGTSSLSAMLAAYRWLRAYPFDCTEQLASTGRALVAVWRATKRERSDALGGDPRAKLQELVGEISKRQRPDGGINYWPGVDWTSAWLTAHAGLFLLEARAEGAVVDAAVIARASAFLRHAADAPIDTGGMNRYEQRGRRLALGERVAAVDYLRRAGEPDVTAERRLLGVASGMTWEDRLRLAESIAPRVDTRAEAEAIVDAAWRAVTPAGHRLDLPDSSHAARAFPSRIGPAARMLSASLVLRPTHPLLGALIETVLQHGRAESALAWSTQDYASVVMALAGLAEIDAGDRVVTARGLAAKFIAHRPRVGIDTTIAASLDGMLEAAPTGKRTLRLHLDATVGDRPIYYALEVEEVPLVAPVTPDAQGIVVERWYEGFNDGAPLTSVKEGDLVRVRLRVTVPADREFVAVEDPLPAGLEAVDLGFRTSSTLAPLSAKDRPRPSRADDIPSDNPLGQRWLYGGWIDGQWSPWEHRELHDDRVSYFARMLWTGSYTATYVARATTSGSFVAPPAYAEEMYNPAVQGRSSGGRFGVERRP